jgi:glycosyltransferase involved in cell wall biosynthesis
LKNCKISSGGDIVGQISIVIPALNEREGIERTIASIPRAELQRMGYDVQVLVVNGDGKDGTGELARKAGAEVIDEPRRGYGQAFKTGFARARGDVIATADADATYPVEDIPNLVLTLEKEDLDFITTNRFAFMGRDAMSRRNRVGNAVLNLVTALLFRLNIKDCQSGMWVFRKNILKKLRLRSNTPLSQEIKIEACHFARCRWKEVSIKYRPRFGRAKCGGWKVGFTNFCDLIRKRVVR